MKRTHIAKGLREVYLASCSWFKFRFVVPCALMSILKTDRDRPWQQGLTWSMAEDVSMTYDRHFNIIPNVIQYEL